MKPTAAERLAEAKRRGFLRSRHRDAPLRRAWRLRCAELKRPCISVHSAGPIVRLVVDLPDGLELSSTGIEDLRRLIDDASHPQPPRWGERRPRAPRSYVAPWGAWATGIRSAWWEPLGPLVAKLVLACAHREAPPSAPMPAPMAEVTVVPAVFTQNGPEGKQ